MPLTMPDRGRNRKIDVGSLVQADATSGTFMFTLTQSDVMRIRPYVPQDAAIGVKPGVNAVVRVPEIPDRTFPGHTVTRSDRAALLAEGQLKDIGPPAATDA
jgi:hypothetical protein